MNCKGCGFWKSDMDPQTGEEIHRCACDASPRLDDETAAEDGCEYGVPPIEDVLRWLDHRLQGTLMPGAERMYRAIQYYLEEATALSTLRAENEKLREELEYEREHANAYHEECGQWEAENTKLRAELEAVRAERDAAVNAVKNMAEYIVCAGRVDYFLCNEISQEHHLKYQPKNDGNYDNGPCYECVADWFMQGNKWGGARRPGQPIQPGGICKLHQFGALADDYCSLGERRETTHD